jgi:hypothetical protein
MKRLISSLAICFLITCAALAQTTYEGKGGGASDLAVNLIADSDSFSGTSISVSNYIIDRLSFHQGVGYYQGNPWFEQALTAKIDDQSESFGSNNINVYFHPTKSDTEGMKFVVAMKNKYFNTPSKISFKAKAYKYKFPYNDTEFILVLIEELTINGKTYKGQIPDSLLE